MGAGRTVVELQISQGWKFETQQTLISRPAPKPFRVKQMDGFPV